MHIVMTFLTEEAERSLDKGMQVSLVRDDKTFIVTSKNAYCYGKIDFNDDSDDYDNLEWVLPELDEPIEVPTDYDFEKHVCRSPVRRYRSIKTLDIVRCAQYKYAMLGKPDKVVIFKFTNEL